MRKEYFGSLRCIINLALHIGAQKGKKMSRFGYNGLVERTGIKKGTLYAMVSRKRIPHIRLSSRLVLFDEKEIEKWLKEHAVPVEEPKVDDDPL